MRFTPRAAAHAFFAMLCCFAPEAASATTFSPLNDNTENISSITANASPQVIYSVPITYNQGDILQAVSEFEVTNDTLHTVHIWAQLILAQNSTDTTGTVLGESNEKAITDTGTHHCTRVKGAITSLSTGGTSQTRYVNVVAWADGDLTVEPGNGRLQGLLITPSTGASFDVYDSGEGSELLTSLSGDNTFQVLYSVNVGDLAVNDILVAFSEAQLDTADPVTGKQRLTAHLLRASTAGGLTGTSMDQANALTITTDVPIGTPVKVAIHEVAGTTTRDYVNFLVQATVDLNVEQGYGRLEVLKIRPAS